MTESRGPLILAIVLLVLLFSLSLVGLAAWSSSLREREEVRRQLTEALTAKRRTKQVEESFRRARAFDAVYVACEKGVQLRDRGLFAEAAESFQACLRGDPDLVAAHLAWGEARLRAHGREVYQEVRTHLRRVVESTRRASRADPALPATEALILDLEDLLTADPLATSGREWSAEDVLEILTRPDIRGNSRYDGPRIPLRLEFRPGGTYLGSAAEPELRRVAWALKNTTLAFAVIQIEGHTDSVEGGSEAARISLARRRAGVVRDFLVGACGVPGERLRVAGFGDVYPLASNATDEGRTRNRRVELVNLETNQRLLQDARRRP
jgi:outer membrane protein OmpA-like peptidoglycan-associated protein